MTGSGGRIRTSLDFNAAGLGFEPKFPRPERGVLPLHHPAIYISKYFLIAKKLGTIPNNRPDIN